MIGTCRKCREWRALTKDHIIPRWAYKAFPFPQIGIKKNLGKVNIEYICGPCNGAKGGNIDCSHELGRMFWTAVRDAINRELAKPQEVRSFPPASGV